MELIRTVCWDADLVIYVKSVIDEPFEWGRTDCATLVRHALKAMYGKDVLRGVGSWRTLAEARRAVKRIGPYETFFKSKGCEEWSPAYRQRGDVAILPSGGDRDGLPGLGVVVRGGVLTVDDFVMILPIEEGTVIMRFPNG